VIGIEAAMPEGQNAVRLRFRRRPCGGAARCLPDDQAVDLIVRPDIEDRSFHEDTKAFQGPERAWPEALRPLPGGFEFAPDAGRRLQVRASSGSYSGAPEWQYRVPHPLEAERGLHAESDLFSPGYFQCPLAGGASVDLKARIVTPSDPADQAKPGAFQDEGGSEDGQISLGEQAVRALRQFVVRRGARKTVIAGYPWFLDWGRDTLICVRGLIAAGFTDEAGAILCQFAELERDGTLPNMLQGGDLHNRDTSDAPLWLIVACADYCRAADGRKLLETACGRRPLRQVLQAIVEGYSRGTPNGIRLDPRSGLIFSPAHFTWMDTNHPAGSPREGYPIEIQALWVAALSFLAGLDKRPGPWPDLARRARESIRRYYWLDDAGCLADCLHARPGQAAADAAPDDALRPNQLLAVTLRAIEDRALAGRILDACSGLLVPGAIRSLADRPVACALPIWHAGRLLNDPLRPYWGRYEGDEDTRRKPAYHNGTAWTWLFPSFCEAWLQTFGRSGRAAALAWLGSSLGLFSSGCLGQLPEIVDGDAPHTSRGCDAQAWAVSEWIRVWKLAAH